MIVSFLLGLAFLSAPVQPASPDIRSPEALFAELERRATAIRFESGRIRMAIIDSRNRSRIRVIDSWTAQRGADSMILVRFHSPADVRGTALLTIKEGRQDVQKLYLPSIGRVQTVGAAQLSDRFMGSDFLFDDLRPVDYSGFRFETRERKPDRWIVRGTPTTARTFAYADYVVDPVKLVLVEATYYDSADKATRKLSVSDFKEVRPGLWRGDQLVMHDLLSNRRTELTWQNRDIESEIPESMFTERELTRF